jgi:hypothetical protein
MNYEILADNALHFPRLLDSPEEYINFCKNEASSVGIKVEPWISGGDIDPHIYGNMWVLRKTTESSTVQTLLSNYDKALFIACREFLQYLAIDTTTINKTIENLKKTRLTDLTVKSYFEGERLGPHPDIDPNTTEDVLHLTVSMYYNDNYEGGEFGIIDGLSVKPTPGSVVIFPSKYLHTSGTIFTGIKYVSNEVIKLDLSLLKDVQ